MFMVHRHLARAAHFDLRLQVGDALASWAVPKGFSYDPADRRLAVHVEEHPLDYGFFEGVIPEGEYGAGPTIVWDRGTWKPDGDAAEGVKSGKLHFELSGYRLRGRWILVRTRQQWLVFKESDGVTAPAHWDDERSVVSGLTAEELASGARARRVEQAVADLGAPRVRKMPATLKPMLCTTSKPFSDPGWLFEVKFDGYRVLAWRSGDRVSLRSRNGHELAKNAPEVIEALSRLPADDFVIDGELVRLAAGGRPDFSRLQQRLALRWDRQVAAASVAQPLTLCAFDLPYCNGRDLRGVPLAARKAVLSGLAPRLGAVQYTDHVDAEGEAFFELASEAGLEGIVGKRADSPWVQRRSDHWRKIPNWRLDEYTVIGYRSSEAVEIAALHIAERDGEAWRYRGRVGSGLDALSAERVRAVAKRRSPVVPVEDAGEEDTWLQPRLDARVRYREVSRSGRLRQPTLAGLAIAPAHIERKPVSLSRPEKILWPGPGLAKRDLYEHYRRAWPLMAGYLQDRALTVIRYPDGVEEEGFFQRHAGAGAPGTPIRVETRADLLELANLAAISIHVPAERLSSPERPEWTVVDIDAKQSGFTEAVQVARALQALTDELGLPLGWKTSGKSGLHAWLPVDGMNHDQAGMIARLLCEWVAARLGDIATTERRVSARGRRIYLDAGQNGQGKTVVAPFSVRATPEATVSMPIRSAELNARLDPGRFTTRSTWRRVGQWSGDPLADVLAAPMPVEEVIERLSAYGGAED